MRMTSGPPNVRWRLGDVVFDPADGTLWRDGQRIDLTPKVLAILNVLVDAAPRMVTKEQLLDAVWPEAVVAEAALTQRVRDLREALGDNARTPRFVETVARRGYRLIAPLEALDQARPPGSGAPSPPSPVSPHQLPTTGALQRPRWWLALALVAALAAAGLGLWRTSRPARTPLAPPTPVPSPFSPRRAIGVMEPRIEPGSGDAAWVATALAEMLTTELGAGGTLRVVSAADLAQALRELGLGAGVPSPQDARRLRGLLGINLLVSGWVSVSSRGSPPELGLGFEIHETASGAVLASIEDAGPLSSLADVAGRCGARLRLLCGVSALPAPEATRIRRLHPESVDAARLHAEGLAKLRLFDFRAAAGAFEQALTIEPASVPIRLALGHALAWTGARQRALAEFRQALESSGSLPRETQLVIEGDYRELAGETARAIEIIRSLHVLYPDNLEYGLSLATLLASHDEGDAAQRVLGSLRQLPEPLGQDPRIDLAEAWMHESDLTWKLAAASRAAERARVLGARLLLAAARIQQGRAYRGLGKPEEALAAFEEAWRLREAADETSGVAKALLHVAAIERDRGALATAASHLEAAAATFRRIGDSGQLIAALRDAGAVAIDQGRLPEAARLIAEAVSLPEADNPEEHTSALLQQVRLVLHGGTPTKAVAAARRAIDACRRQKMPGAEALARAYLARALLEAREIDAAAIESDLATRLAAATDNRAVHLEVAIAAARVAVERSECPSAHVALEQAMAEAASAPVGLRLEAELVAAECSQQLGDVAGAATARQAVATTASELGFRLIAAAARRALTAAPR